MILYFGRKDAFHKYKFIYIYIYEKWHIIGSGDCLLKTQDMLSSNTMYIV